MYFKIFFKATMNLTNVHAGNEAALKVIYASLTLVCKVFYSLNYQDLPEFFEDNMETWMTTFLKLLTTDVACLRTAVGIIMENFTISKIILCFYF